MVGVRVRVHDPPDVSPGLTDPVEGLGHEVQVHVHEGRLPGRRVRDQVPAAALGMEVGRDFEAADGAVAGAVLKVDLPYRVLATSESLPHTGTDTDRLAGLGLVLLLGGAFLILVTRKRRENA